MSDQHEHHHEAGGHEHGHHGSGTALTLISLAHGINHAQSAPAARLSVGIGPTGFWLRRARYYARGRQRRGGSLQLVAGGLGRFIKRHLLLGARQCVCGNLLRPHRRRTKLSAILFSGRSCHAGGAAQHPVGSAFVAPFSAQTFGYGAGGAFYRGKRSRTALIPLFAAILISSGAGASRRFYSRSRRSSLVWRCAFS